MPNDLIHETSPYLLQHANNPVDWMPWSDKALALSRELDKPILLSIGYAACHWCHVMAHESFEDEAIAAQMNKLFVCVKVDREERPDLDRIYQSAHQMLTQRPGGWPLTVALTPDRQAPFFAGTYFPPEPRQGMPGFTDLMDQISTHYESNRESMEQHGSAFANALSRLNPTSGEQPASSTLEWLDAAAASLKQRFDPVNGGFGDAPRFPHPTQLALLLRHGSSDRADQDVSLAMANKTMRKMARGGLFDQIGGGFYRYSVDKHWRIPHFEKMLYDNAQLLDLYIDGFARTGELFHREAARRTALWVIAEMQQEHGGYASSLDADSEGDEGKFYVWSETDLRAVLTSDQYEAVEQRFSLYGEPNFEGSWHFNVNPDLDEETLHEPSDDLATALATLRDLRAERIRPDIDDKILTSWNGLMIRAMANAGRQLDDSTLIDSARASLDFVRSNLWRDGRLLASYRDGAARLNAYLDDYVFLADGILALLQQQWRAQDYLMLISLCDAILEWFEDTEHGGFFFTSHDHEALLHRPKSGADDAIPAANGVAVRLLFQVGMLSGDRRYQQAAQRTLALFAGETARSPSVYAGMLLGALDSSLEARSVILRGKPEDVLEWQQAIAAMYLPGTVVLPLPWGSSDVPNVIEAKAAESRTASATVCLGDRCLAPVGTIESLVEAIGGNDKRSETQTFA